MAEQRYSGDKAEVARAQEEEEWALEVAGMDAGGFGVAVER